MAAGPVPNEITKCDYEVRLKELVELIEISDFVAIDCTVETTGFLLRDEEFNPAYMKDVDDWAGVWYDDIKAKEKSHCLLEVGIAVFKRVPSHPKEIEAEVFNIPVLPACIDDNEIARFRGRTSVRLNFDGYGQQFIKTVEFDMNKVLYMAAPYLNRQLQEQADTYMTENPNFMAVARKRRLNPYLMPKLFNEVTEIERKSIIERLKGVSKVFEAISRCKIPVVGHHLLLKLIFIYKDFIEYLPETYPECMDKITNYFKTVYDTKQLAKDIISLENVAASSSLFERIKLSKDINLYELLRNFNTFKENESNDGFTLYVGGRSEFYVEDILDLFEGEKVEDDTESFCYVAGFDALACGILFLNFVQIMETTDVYEHYSSSNMQTTPNSNQDYLEMFLKGEANYFLNKLYKAPILPDSGSTEVREIMHIKRLMWRQKMEQEQKERMAKTDRLIAMAQNLKPRRY